MCWSFLLIIDVILVGLAGSTESFTTSRILTLSLYVIHATCARNFFIVASGRF